MKRKIINWFRRLLLSHEIRSIKREISSGVEYDYYRWRLSATEAIQELQYLYDLLVFKEQELKHLKQNTMKLNGPYFNTNKETGEVLEQSRRKATTQEKRILWLFNTTGQEYTPDEVYSILYKETGTPITSVRRAMSNLTAQGRLVKTDKQRPGAYGKTVHTWKLA